MELYSTLLRTVEPLVTLNPNRVSMFVCGPTVYDYSHLGHARTYVVFDVLAKYLRWTGKEVFYLQNITDVDDKIINRANAENVSQHDLSRRFEIEYLRDMRALGVDSVSYYARATTHIPEIINQVERLISRGAAYVTEGGVYFNVGTFEHNGELSHQHGTDRVSRITDETKQNSLDFALWKLGEFGEYTWDSPWGRGRPGWHIEDTAISEKYFGQQYDIHGGGLDLIFPHHEAEIAQMESLEGKHPMVRYWLHTGFLTVKGEKMSKSLGNFITIRDALKTWNKDVLRYFILLSHYSSPLQATDEGLDNAARALEHIRAVAQKDTGENPEGRKAFTDAMESDLNTPNALAAIQTLAASGDILALKEFGEILGINFLRETSAPLSILQEIRAELRANKQFAVADMIRERMVAAGITITDAPL
ncbi:cysteine--tRNA ligase [Methanosphaerula palustris]|uniref:Cysteine--tRNA ligase n=1 Tax=Methanosphaerula palustris (strain ATCC BAA-1556 / DSM 19958 / E1-9c) TaxID=521011 RepID=B8GH96_METPE|nr:cysteine--tRNA ligase [Methanosphaerula palustris]ACL16501.1 cysteinyl-tRNA synthetase [Methanosphaerula palustris E1-9c]